MRTLGTICIWTATILSVLVAAGLAFVLVSMPLSLDPTDLVTAGAEPWLTALYAGAGFVAVLVAGIVSLRLWHSVRMKPVAIALTIVEVIAVGWAAIAIYDEFF